MTGSVPRWARFAMLGAMCLAATATAAAERTATIQLRDRTLPAASVPIREVAVWRVTDLRTQTPTELPVGRIESIRAPRISGTCRVSFGTVHLADGTVVEFAGNLRDLFDIPARWITVTFADPVSGNRVAESFLCNAWRRMDFIGTAPSGPD